MRGGWGVLEWGKNIVKGNISADEFIKMTNEINNEQDFKDKAAKYLSNISRLDEECASKLAGSPEYLSCESQKAVLYGHRLEIGGALLADSACTDELCKQIVEQNKKWGPVESDHYDKSKAVETTKEPTEVHNDSSSNL
jgi:hypothetical protein